MTLDEKKARYLELAHAMQSGVKYWMELGDEETSPKHLRVGVNSAMVEQGAAISLLVKKGIITDDEWFDALIEFMQREVLSYEERLSAHFGKKVNLL